MFMYSFPPIKYIAGSFLLWIYVKRPPNEVLMNFRLTPKIIFYWFLSGENLMAADNFLYLNIETIRAFESLAL